MTPVLRVTWSGDEESVHRVPGLFPPSVAGSSASTQGEGFSQRESRQHLAQPRLWLGHSTGPRFKATHTLESKEGATLVSECTGGFCGRAPALLSWAPCGLCPQHLGRLLPFGYSDASQGLGPHTRAPPINVKPRPQQQSYQRVSPPVRQPGGAEVVRSHPGRV